MKKLLFLLAMLPAFSQFLFAQTYWNASGSNIYNSNSGYVGIGTQSPSTTLDVNGTGNFGSNAAATNVFQLNLSNSYYGISGVSYPGQFRWYASPNNSLYKDNALYQLRSWDGGTNTENTMLTFTGSGSVGIGSTTPLQKLEVAGSSVASAAPQTNISAYGGNGIRLTGTGGNSQDGIMYSSSGGGGAGIAFRRGGSYDTYMDFYTNNGSSSGAINQAMTINNIGYVGIGTTFPKYGLDVQNGNASVYHKGIATTFKVGGESGKTQIFLSTSADAGGYGILQTVSVAGSSYGNTIINPTGGNVGIGTANAAAKLTIQESSNTALQLVNSAGNQTWGFASDAAVGGDQKFGLIDQTAGQLRLTIDKNGYMGIGTSSPDQMLTVNGTVHSTQVIVTSTVPYPDYVFKPTYRLPKINDVKRYIDRNHHLPEVPSEAEVIKSGLNIGKSEALLLKKVEELTLYMIQLKEQNDAQQKQFDQQRQALVRQQKVNRSLQRQVGELTGKLLPKKLAK